MCVFSELKSQYAEVHSSGTNINELPQLLQGIHNLKPTVYKTGTQQQQQRQSKYTDSRFLIPFTSFLSIFVYIPIFFMIFLYFSPHTNIFPFSFPTINATDPAKRPPPNPEYSKCVASNAILSNRNSRSTMESNAPTAHNRRHQQPYSISWRAIFFAEHVAKHIIHVLSQQRPVTIPIGIDKNYTKDQWVNADQQQYANATGQRCGCG